MMVQSRPWLAQAAPAGRVGWWPGLPRCCTSSAGCPSCWQDRGGRA